MNNPVLAVVASRQLRKVIHSEPVLIELSRLATNGKKNWTLEEWKDLLSTFDLCEDTVEEFVNKLWLA